MLSYRDAVEAADGDARTLLTLLALRRVWPAGGERAVRIVAEVLEQDDVALAQAGGVDDWIVSDEVTSLMLAQLSERTELAQVFLDLFSPDGARLSFRPAHRYVGLGPVSYGSVVAAGALRDESVLGWRVAATGSVHLNPAKSAAVHLVAEDQVLVVESRG